MKEIETLVSEFEKIELYSVLIEWFDDKLELDNILSDRFFERHSDLILTKLKTIKDPITLQKLNKLLNVIKPYTNPVYGWQTLSCTIENYVYNLFLNQANKENIVVCGKILQKMDAINYDAKDKLFNNIKTLVESFLSKNIDEYLNDFPDLFRGLVVIDDDKAQKFINNYINSIYERIMGHPSRFTLFNKYACGLEKAFRTNTIFVEKWFEDVKDHPEEWLNQCKTTEDFVAFIHSIRILDSFGVSESMEPFWPILDSFFVEFFPGVTWNQIKTLYFDLPALNPTRASTYFRRYQNLFIQEIKKQFEKINYSDLYPFIDLMRSLAKPEKLDNPAKSNKKKFSQLIKMMPKTFPTHIEKILTKEKPNEMLHFMNKHDFLKETEFGTILGLILKKNFDKLVNKEDILFLFDLLKTARLYLGPSYISKKVNLVNKRIENRFYDYEKWVDSNDINTMIKIFNFLKQFEDFSIVDFLNNIEPSLYQYPKENKMSIITFFLFKLIKNYHISNPSLIDIVNSKICDLCKIEHYPRRFRYIIGNLSNIFNDNLELLINVQRTLIKSYILPVLNEENDFYDNYYNILYALTKVPKESVSGWKDIFFPSMFELLNKNMESIKLSSFFYTLDDLKDLLTQDELETYLIPFRKNIKTKFGNLSMRDFKEFITYNRFPKASQFNFLFKGTAPIFVNKLKVYFKTSIEGSFSSYNDSLGRNFSLLTELTEILKNIHPPIILEILTQLKSILLNDLSQIKDPSKKFSDSFFEFLEVLGTIETISVDDWTREIFSKLPLDKIDLYEEAPISRLVLLLNSKVDYDLLFKIISKKFRFILYEKQYRKILETSQYIANIQEGMMLFWNHKDYVASAIKSFPTHVHFSDFIRILNRRSLAISLFVYTLTKMEIKPKLRLEVNLKGQQIALNEIHKQHPFFMLIDGKLSKNIFQKHIDDLISVLKIYHSIPKLYCNMIQRFLPFICLLYKSLLENNDDYREYCNIHFKRIINSPFVISANGLFKNKKQKINENLIKLSNYLTTFTPKECDEKVLSFLPILKKNVSFKPVGCNFNLSQ
ncbi:MAG: hypothetical protein EU541_08420 [Promethearchaeota archaeon]|nr:MAG: hypothetical protein EU541_08420 [Candidatus Lokiarchaeota archaeon]